MPDRTVTVVTGANSGIGLDAAHRVARTGGTLVLLCRNEARGLPARDAIRRASGNEDVHLVTADFASLAEVRHAADTIASRWPRLTGLVNNAGLARMERSVTGDGYEQTMQVNHLAPFLLTLGLLGPLRAGTARVVNVASAAHHRGKLERLPLEEILRGPADYKGFQAYCDSKLANVLFTNELARRERESGVTAVALHPGTLSTAIWDRNPGWTYWVTRLLKVFMDKPEVGGDAAAYLVAHPDAAGRTGAYYEKRNEATPSKAARDPALARALWEVSAQAVGLDAPEADTAE